MIDGLKLTMTGEELRARLDERVKDHERRATWYRGEAKREPGAATDDDPDGEFILPEHMCEHESSRHEWRAEVLAYIREHIEGGEVYRLGEADLAFGEMLPEAPGLVEQEEYEEAHRIGFSLERIAKEVGRGRFDPYELMELQAEAARKHAHGPSRTRKKRATKRTSA